MLNYREMVRGFGPSGPAYVSSPIGHLKVKRRALDEAYD